MKTKIAILLSVIIALTGLFIACQLEEAAPERVTVTFDSNGRDPVNPGTLDRGGSLGGAYPVPGNDENFTFTGWYDGFTEYTRETKIYADITLTARWAEIIAAVEYVNVTFDSDNGSTVGTIAVAKDGVLGSKFPAAPRKKGFVFEQWLLNGGEKLTKDTVISGSITVTAQWSQLTDIYTVTFVTGDGGEDIEDMEVYAGECIDEWELRFPVDAENAEPLLFVKEWHDETGLAYTGRTRITKNVTLTAVWGIKLERTTFTLDLSDYTTESFNIAGASSVAHSNGVLTVTFTGENQGISIANSEALRLFLADANTVEVEIDGEANPANRLFRVLIGNPHKLGREWNATVSHDNVPFAELNRTLEIEETNRGHDKDETVWGDDNNPPNTPDMHRVNWLFIQARGTDHTSASPTTVTIRSIKITVE